MQQICAVAIVGINLSSFHALSVTLLSLEEVNPIPAVKNTGLPSICFTPDASLEMSAFMSWFQLG